MAIAVGADLYPLVGRVDFPWVIGRKDYYDPSQSRQAETLLARFINATSLADMASGLAKAEQKFTDKDISSPRARKAHDSQ